MDFIATWLVSAIAVGAAIWLTPGITVVGGAYAGPLFTALFLAIVNASIKPVLKIIGLPFTILSLGLSRWSSTRSCLSSRASSRATSRMPASSSTASALRSSAPSSSRSSR